MVKSGLKQKEYDGRVKVEPINLAVHLICGVGLYSAIFFTALTCLRRNPETVLNTLEMVTAGAKARKKFMGLLHLSFITMFSGALVAGSEAGKVHNNWPFYTNNYVFPDDAFNLEPFYKNFIQNRSTIQFVHRSLAYLTFFTVLDLVNYMNSVKTILPFMLNTHLIFFFANLQILLGITTLINGARPSDALHHQLNGLVMLTSVLYGLHTFRKPNKEFIAKLLAK